MKSQPADLTRALPVAYTSDAAAAGGLMHPKRVMPAIANAGTRAAPTMGGMKAVANLVLTR